MRSLTLLFGALLTTGPTAAAAEDAGANITRMRRTPLYAKSILDAAYATPAWAMNGCEHHQASLGDTPSLVAEPVRADDRGRPLAGAWIEHVMVEGCGEALQLNVLVYVQAPGALATAPLLPGTTRADPLLQRDGTVFALRYAALAEPTPCKDAIVANTVATGAQPGRPAIPGKPGWLERWTVKLCGKQIDVEMRFTPDATGTSVAAGKAS